jgi:hypothetical protein
MLVKTNKCLGVTGLYSHQEANIAQYLSPYSGAISFFTRVYPSGTLGSSPGASCAV